MHTRGRYIRHLALVVAVLIGGMGTTLVATAVSTSPNYQVTEMEFGASNSDKTCSGEYCAYATLGDITSGPSKAGPSGAKFSPITDEQPRLEVIVDPGVSDLGVLSSTRTATKTTTVRVLSYLSDGYMMQIIGDSPKYGSHTLATPGVPTASEMGKEQFGLNVVNNTTPNVGADPVQTPSNQTSFGRAAEGYDTADLFKYVSGDVVATSDTESGQTDYTVSMIVNVSNATPAGRYSGDFSVVVIPMY